MKIMTFTKWSKYLNLRESVKDETLNSILDKISKSEKLTKREEEFLSKFDKVLEKDLMSFSHLSKNDVCSKIDELRSSGKKVICDLYDSFGKIDDEIISIDNDFENDVSILKLKHGETTKIYDRFLYNLSYDFKHDCYSLTSQEEYFEKIPITDDEN
jgi:hypothetical protein